MIRGQHVDQLMVRQLGLAGRSSCDIDWNIHLQFDSLENERCFEAPLAYDV